MLLHSRLSFLSFIFRIFNTFTINSGASSIPVTTTRRFRHETLPLRRFFEFQRTAANRLNFRFLVRRFVRLFIQKLRLLHAIVTLATSEGSSPADFPTLSSLLISERVDTVLASISGQAEVERNWMFLGLRSRATIAITHPYITRAGKRIERTKKR